MLSRRGFDSRHLHQERTGSQELLAGLYRTRSMLLMGMTWISIGRIVRDGNTVGDDRKSSTIINANKTAFEFFEVDVAVNDSEFALVA